VSLHVAPPEFDASALGRLTEETLTRFDVPGPRYTSYPTAPAWSDDFGRADYARALEQSAQTERPLAVYVHLPFCESLCIYCGCNVVITKRREKAARYLDRVLGEIDRVAELARASDRKCIQVAWGGGTPTYLEPDQIELLAGRIAERFPLADDAEVAIEVDPRVTTREHVRSIVRAGFNRISMGIQDFTEEVQHEIHRVQPYDMTAQLIDWCRTEGLDSVNVDLVYGLPLQTLAGFDRTITLVRQLDPDRVSAFSYAHVPWLKPGQKKFDDATIPHGAQKFAIFTRLVERLCGDGYAFIGMDHFAKPDNELSIAQREGGLWRNFQGFTTKSGTDLVGLGVTSIGQFERAYAQNEKDLAAYQDAQDAGGLAVVRGTWLSDDDLVRQRVIHHWMCNYRLVPSVVEAECGIDFASYFADEIPRLEPLVEDGMVRATDDGWELTSWGRVFVRNVCMVFDAHLPRKGERRYSRTL
jgi:oxygen-independent coproporphyrinogen-3 oxidase